MTTYSAKFARISTPSGVAATDQEIRRMMLELMGTAVEQIKAGQ